MCECVCAQMSVGLEIDDDDDDRIARLPREPNLSFAHSSASSVRVCLPAVVGHAKFAVDARVFFVVCVTCRCEPVCRDSLPIPELNPPRRESEPTHTHTQTD